MTNILFFSQLLRDDSSSVADTESEISEIDLEQRSRERLATRGAVFMAIGKAYHAIARSVHLGASSPAVKIEISTSEDGREVLNQDGPSEERRKSSTLLNYQQPRNFPNHVDAELVAAGWPSWLTAVCGEAIMGWIPRRADTFEKLDKIGQGKHSNVYKGKDLLTGKIVALKKVKFEYLEPESVKFMAREILILRRLDHPNVMKLEGLVTSRMSSSLYLVFEYMEHDLAGLAANSEINFTESQIKCYMHQMLLGLEHCHNRGVLHCDIKGADLLLDNEGVLKIADFGLASFFDPQYKHPMTSRVVSLWNRPPELLLGGTDYGVGVDLWSAGCILAELIAGRPIMPGRTEVEQLHRIFKLCGSPSEKYWQKSKLPYETVFRPQQPYKRCIAETFKDLPPSSLSLIETLLSIDPSERQTATAALTSEFFSTNPYRCEPSSLPRYPPSRSMGAEVAKRPSTVGITNATAPAISREAIKAVHAATTNVPSNGMLGIPNPTRTLEHPLSPMCRACQRMDLTTIHQLLVTRHYRDDNGMYKLSSQEWLQQMVEILEARKRGDLAFRNQDFNLAIDCYSEFIDVAIVVSPTVYARRSLCHLFCDQPDAALRDAVKAEIAYPDWPTASYMQAVALVKLDMHKDAVDMLNEAADLEDKRQLESGFSALNPQPLGNCKNNSRFTSRAKQVAFFG